MARVASSRGISIQLALLKSSTIDMFQISCCIQGANLAGRQFQSRALESFGTEDSVTASADNQSGYIEPETAWYVIVQYGHLPARLITWETMLFHVRLTHRPENCWARDENEGKPTEMVARIEDTDESSGVNVRSAALAPNEHTFFLMVEADTVEGLTALLGPPILRDHEADVVPVTAIGNALNTLDLE